MITFCNNFCHLKNITIDSNELKVALSAPGNNNDEDKDMFFILYRGVT
jgi:phage-related protein